MKTFYPLKKSQLKITFLLALLPCTIGAGRVSAQNSISYSCAQLNISANAPLNCQPISEDDPNDLAECYSMLIAYLPGNNQHIEFHIPARTGTYRLTQGDTRSDSLAAVFYDNTNPQVYGNEVTVYPSDFTITVSRYDSNRAGIVEGTFSGTMEGSASGHRGKVNYNIKGSFHTTRNGQIAECRKLRRSERQACNAIGQSLVQNLEMPLTNAGWEVQRQNAGPKTVANNPNPYRPLMSCNGSFDEKLSLSSNTPMGRMLDDSIRYYRKMETKEDVMNMYRLLAMKEVKIGISENRPYLKSKFSHGPNDKYTVLTVNGASFACREVVQRSADEINTSTYVFLGNWTGADMNANQYVNYPFVHKQAGPYIESLVFRMTGPPAVIDKLVNVINWRGISAALSK